LRRFKVPAKATKQERYWMNAYSQTLCKKIGRVADE